MSMGELDCREGGEGEKGGCGSAEYDEREKEKTGRAPCQDQRVMWAGLGHRPLVGRRWASVRQRTYLRKFDASAVHLRAGGSMAGSGHGCLPLLCTVSLPGYRGHVDLPNPMGATATVFSRRGV